MTASFYIIVDQKGNVDLRKTGNFAVPAGQVATRLEIEIPDEAFAPIEVATVKFSIPTNALRRTVEVEATVERRAEGE